MKKTTTLLLLLSLFLGARAQNVSNGLQACYPFDGSAANYAATGPVLNGVINNVTSAAGHTGLSNTAYSLHGNTSSYIVLPSQSALKSDSVFFSGWFYIDSLPNEQYLVYTKNTCSYDFEAFSLITYHSGTSNHQVFRVSKSGSSCNYAPQVDSQITPVTGSWYHVCFYIDNSVIKLYVNGALQGTSAHNIHFAYQSGKQVFLGVTNETNFNLPYKGKIDNVRFYNRELSLQEINILFTQDPHCSAANANTPATAFTASKYQLCKGQSVTLTDQSTNSPTAWNWQMPGATPASSSAGNPVVSFASAGIYTVSLTSSNGSGAGNTAVQTITVSTCLSVPENGRSGLPVSIYPNPNAGRLYVDHLAASHLTLFDITGKQIGCNIKQVDEDRVEISFEENAPGIYFMKALDKEGNYLGTFKILKN